MELAALRRAVASERLYGVDHLSPAPGPRPVPADGSLGARPGERLCVRAAAEEFEGPAGELLERMLAALGLPAGRIRRERSASDPGLLVLEVDPQQRVTTYAPARLLAEPALKAHAWADLTRVMEILGLPIP